MIEVNLYRQFMVELGHRALRAYNSENPDKEAQCFSSCLAAVNEGQLITLLKDRTGLVFCGNVPGAELTRRTSVDSEGQCILYILEKSVKDWQGTDREFDRFALMQRLMSKVCELLMGDDAYSLLCQSGRMKVDRLVVEPEYNIYGGFNGWSVTFKLPDGKGTGV